MNSIFLPQLTDRLNIYPSPLYQVLNVNWSAFLKGILSALQSESRLEQWHPWRVPIGQWGPGRSPTYYVAHYCVIGHCVGTMAAYGVSQMVVFSTSYPIPPHSTHPTHPSIINTDSRKGRQKYLEIQPLEIEKVSYNKSQ